MLVLGARHITLNSQFLLEMKFDQAIYINLKMSLLYVLWKISQFNLHTCFLAKTVKLIKRS